MSAEVWYWLFMALWLFFGAYSNRAAFSGPGWVGPVGGFGVQFILFLIIGFRLFGSPIK